MVAEVGAQAFQERVVAGERAELLEDCLALGVGDGVEVRHRLRHIGDVAADRVVGRPHVEAIAVLLPGGEEGGPALGVPGGTRSRPASRPGGEGLVEPQVVPPAHRHQVAEPHVGHLVQHEVGDLASLVVRRLAARQREVAAGDAAPVLHRSAQVGHEHVVVTLLGERDPEVLAEPSEPLLGELEQLLGVAVEQLLQRLPAVQPEVVTTTLRPQLVERAGIDHHNVRRQRRRVGERPEAPAVSKLLYRRAGRVAEHRPRRGGADDEAVDRLEVGLVEVRPGHPGEVALEARPEVDELVAGVDGPLDPVGAGGVGLRRRDHQDVLGAEVGQGQPATLSRRRVERHAVEGRAADLGDTVDERGRARLAAGEGHGRGRLEHLPLEQSPEVHRDVVARHLDERRTLLGLAPGQAGNRLHRATVVQLKRWPRYPTWVTSGSEGSAEHGASLASSHPALGVQHA